MKQYTIINGELYHYGVQGMKWGVRKAKLQAKAEKRSAMNKALDDYYKKTNKINSKYASLDEAKGYSKKDQKAIDDANKQYRVDVNLAKQKYKDFLNSPEYKKAVNDGKKKTAKTVAAIGGTTLTVAAAATSVLAIATVGAFIGAVYDIGNTIFS